MAWIHRGFTIPGHVEDVTTNSRAALAGKGVRGAWAVVLLLCVIAIAASVRRLVALSYPGGGGASPRVSLDAGFLEKAALTRAHVIAGLLMALAIPVQVSARVRREHPRVHRWLGRLLVLLGLAIGVSGLAMVRQPIGGALEVSAIAVYGATFIVAIIVGWVRGRQGDFAGHREWMLRALSIVLGIATTRPVVALFLVTSPLTGLQPAQFFGVAFWVGFSVTAGAGEWYVRKTRLIRDS